MVQGVRLKDVCRCIQGLICIIVYVTVKSNVSEVSKVWYPRRISKICISKTFLSKTFISKTCIIYSVYPRPIYSRPVYPRLVYPRLVTKACICMLVKSERGVARAGWILGGTAGAHWSNKPSRRLADLEIGPPQSIQNHTLGNSNC